MRIPAEYPYGSEPVYSSTAAAGADLRAHLQEPVTIEPGCREAIPTGVRLVIPEGYEGQVRPRSGLALNHGVTVLNAPGTIDSDYRGEIKVILFNFSDRPFKIKNRDRIAQLVFSQVARARFVRVKRLNRTGRQDGGMGHTGI